MRMEGSRLPKQIFCSELARGTRRRQGSQTKRYKDSLKNALCACDIPVKGWGHLAADRSAWRLSGNPQRSPSLRGKATQCHSLTSNAELWWCVSVWETESRDRVSYRGCLLCHGCVTVRARSRACVCVSVSLCVCVCVCECGVTVWCLSVCVVSVCGLCVVCVCVWRHCHAWLRTAFSSVNQPQCQSVTQSVSVSVVAAVTVPRFFVKLGLYNSRKLSLWHVSLRPVYYKAGPNHETARNAPL